MQCNFICFRWTGDVVTVKKCYILKPFRSCFTETKNTKLTAFKGISVVF